MNATTTVPEAHAAIVVSSEQQQDEGDHDNNAAAVAAATPQPLHSEEAEDTFPTSTAAAAAPMLILDRESMALLSSTSFRRRRGRGNDTHSVATTALASAVGSVVRPPKNAYLKSFTFRKESVAPNQNEEEEDPTVAWGIQFRSFNNDTTTSSSLLKKRGGSFRKQKTKLYVSEIVEGSLFSLSKFQEGEDYLKSINQKRIDPSSSGNTPESALECMRTGQEKDGYVSVTVQNKQGDDMLVQATVLKPRPNMTYNDLGLVVWRWPCLCIKSIAKNSIFRPTVLQSTDDILSINDIDCDTMTPENFAHIVDELPLEITITVLRRKQRLSGMFS